MVRLLLLAIATGATVHVALIPVFKPSAAPELSASREFPRAQALGLHLMTLALHAATLLGAFLLFLIQPLMAKQILPEERRRFAPVSCSSRSRSSPATCTRT